MIYRFGNYELDAQRCELRCTGQQVAIEPRVFDVLVYLLQHRDRVVTKEELLEQCWADTFVSEAALTRCRESPASCAAGSSAYHQNRLWPRLRLLAPVTTMPPAPSLPIMPSHRLTTGCNRRSKILIVDD